MSFRPLRDFPGYEISEDGVVRSWRMRGRAAPGSTARQAHEVTPIWLKSNRWAVRLNKDGKRYLRCVANLVLETFVGPAPSGVGHAMNEADVLFLDGDPSNVTLKNLNWRMQ